MRKNENESCLALRAGFTLIEILVAVAIIGILGTVAIVNVMSNLESAKATAAQESVNNIKNAVLTYNLKYKKYPSDIRDLIKEDSDGNAAMDGGEGALEDPWGSEYKYERKGNKILVYSAGPDGEFGTDDDIRSDKIKASKKNN